MDSESSYTAHPVVQWQWAPACNLCSALLRRPHLQELSHHPRDQSSVLSVLSHFPQPFVMMESSGNDFADFGPVSDREKPWWPGGNRAATVGISGSVTNHNLSGLNCMRQGTDFRSQSMTQALEVLQDRIPRSRAYSPPLQPASNLLSLAFGPRCPNHSIDPSATSVRSRQEYPKGWFVQG